MRYLFKGLAFSLTALVSMSIHAHSGHGGHEHHGHDQGHGHHAHERVFPDPATVAAPEGVSVSGCWIRALPNRLPAAAYFRLQNAGAQDAILIGAQAEGFGKVMLHTHQEVNGMAAMAHVDEVVVPAGGGFDFAPRGHHIMLEQPGIDLEVGTRQPITLWFEGLHAITAQCDVRPPGTLQ